jgi:hypothetical protein
MASKKPSSKGLEHKKFCAKLHQPHNSSGKFKINTSTRPQMFCGPVGKALTLQSNIQQLQSTMFHDHHIAEEICDNYFKTLSREVRNKEKRQSKEFKIQ